MAAAAHSVLRPSAAGEWVNCNGSVLMQLMHPGPDDTPDTLEGDCAHDLASRMVTSAARANSGFPSRDFVIGSLDANSIEVTPEMYDACLLYAEDVRREMLDRSVFTPHVEEKVSIWDIHSLLWGTPDCWLYDRKAGVLIVWDFKYGHDLVEPFENWQLLCYLAGILRALGIDGYQDQHLRVSLRVVQPRAYHRDGPIREWVRMACDFRPYFNILYHEAAKAMGPDPVTVSGPWCKNCSALAHCETARRSTMAAVDYIGNVTSTDLDNDALAMELRTLRRAVKAAENLLVAREEQASAKITAGEYVPGYAIEAGKGRRRWTIPADEVIALGKQKGVSLEKVEKSVVTPTQARNLGVDETVIKQYSETPNTGFKLVESHKTRAAATFGKR